MHTGGRSAAGLLASAVAISSLVILSTPASAEDRMDDLVWVTAHDEPQPNVWRSLGALAPDGDWAIVDIDPGFTSGEEQAEPGASHLADLDAGTLSQLDGWVRSISDDGQTAVFVSWASGTFSVADLSTGWSRPVAPGEALDEVAVSGDGSSLLLTFEAAEYGADQVLAIEPVIGGERTIVSTVVNQSYDRISHDGSTVLFDSFDGDTSTVHRWRDGVTVDVGIGQALDTSDDLDTLVLMDADGRVSIWDAGVVTPLETNPESWLSATIAGDGSTVAWLAEDGIVRRDVATGDDELVVELPAEVEMLTLELDADGDTMLYQPAIQATGEIDLHLWRDGDGSQVICCEQVSSPFRTANPALLSDDGTRVVFASQQPIADDDPDEGAPEVFAWDVDAPRRAPSVSIADVDATEGQRWGLGVNISTPVDHDVTVVVEAENLTADDDDWTVEDGELVIPAGHTFAGFEATFWADTDDEVTETASLSIVSVDGAEIRDGEAEVTIHDAASPTVTVGDVRRQEWASAQYWRFPVTLSTYARDVVVTLTTRDGGDPLRNAMAGVDYVAKTATVTIPRGSTSAVFVVRVNGDVVPELDETFTVEVTDVTGAVVGDGVGLGTIKDDDPQIGLPVRFV